MKEQDCSSALTSMQFLVKCLKDEAEEFQVDILFLAHILRGGSSSIDCEDKSPFLMLADQEILSKAFQKYYTFLPEFHRRKKIPIDS